MNPSDLLRFDWKPSLVRLALAALRDAGPVSEDDWSVRSGVPRNHLLPSLREAVKNGLIKCEMMAEGLRLLVQPFEFWTGPDVDELSSRVEWDRSWRVSGQARMTLATEAPGLAEVLAALARQPDSGAPTNRIPVPDSGVDRADRDRSGTREKGIYFSRVPDREDRVEPDSGDAGARAYLLTKLRRMHRLEQEILKPQSGFQERMGRLFWELECADANWLMERVGELADRVDIRNKSAWLNRTMTSRVAMLRAKREVRA